VNPVKVGHVVCTYRREEDIAEKVSEFSEPIPGHHLYIIDNGNTLEHIETDNLSVIGSPNLGGSGGFTNGILHALDDGCTHIILNDDDALVSRESVFRMVMFAGMLRPEFSDACIAGTMLDIGDPSIVYESGAQVVSGCLQSLKKGLDISNDKDLIELFGDERIDYVNWTFLCIPSSAFREHGLPLPLFIHEDDVEFGLRIKRKTITLPGLYIWHPAYSDKFAPINYYYYSRNRMVVLSCSGGIPEGYIDRICNDMGIEAAAYRYECCEEMIDGMRDFLRGPDHVFSLCRQSNRKGRTIELQDVDTLRDGLNLIDHAPAADLKLRRRTLNGITSRAAGDIEASPFDMDTAHFYRIGKVLYRVRDEGFIAKRSRLKAISCAVRITLLKRKVKKAAPSLVKEYQASMGRYASRESWEEMLRERYPGSDLHYIL